MMERVWGTPMDAEHDTLLVSRGMPGVSLAGTGGGGFPSLKSTV
jgi:hypothetical protein